MTGNSERLHRRLKEDSDRFLREWLRNELEGRWIGRIAETVSGWMEIEFVHCRMAGATYLSTMIRWTFRKTGSSMMYWWIDLDLDSCGRTTSPWSIVKSPLLNAESVRPIVFDSTDFDCWKSFSRRNHRRWQIGLGYRSSRPWRSVQRFWTGRSYLDWPRWILDLFHNPQEVRWHRTNQIEGSVFVVAEVRSPPTYVRTIDRFKIDVKSSSLTVRTFDRHWEIWLLIICTSS